jgi:hypothetical protein
MPVQCHCSDHDVEPETAWAPSRTPGRRADPAAAAIVQVDHVIDSTLSLGESQSTLDSKSVKDSESVRVDNHDWDAIVERCTFITMM